MPDPPINHREEEAEKQEIPMQRNYQGVPAHHHKDEILSSWRTWWSGAVVLSLSPWHSQSNGCFCNVSSFLRADIMFKLYFNLLSWNCYLTLDWLLFKVCPGPGPNIFYPEIHLNEGKIMNASWHLIGENKKVFDSLTILMRLWNSWLIGGEILDHQHFDQL